MMIHVIFTVFIVAIAYSRMLTTNDALEMYYPSPDRYDDLLNDNDFYRVEKHLFSGNVDAFSNDNIIYNYRSTFQYNTMASGTVNQYMQALEVTNHNNTVGYNGFSFRTRLLILNHVRYIMIRESELKNTPYGFNLKGYVWVEKYDPNKQIQSFGGNLIYEDKGYAIEKAYIYENEHFLNFGFMMYETISKSTFLDLDPLEKEHVLLSHMVIEDIESDHNESIDAITYNEVSPEVIDAYQMKIVIAEVRNQEVYIKIEGFNFFDPIKIQTETTYQTKSHKVSEINYRFGSNMYTDNTTHLVNLGYYEDELNLEIMITFDHLNVSFDSITYALIDMSHVSHLVSSLNRHTMQDVTFNTNGFSGNIETLEDGYLVVGLPYTKGFKAYINGDETFIHQANIGFMAIQVPAGFHEVTFIYETPGLYDGFIISLISLSMIVLIMSIRYFNHFVRILSKKTK
jgi:uncharacterized membrane protein YfhO